MRRWNHREIANGLQDLLRLISWTNRTPFTEINRITGSNLLGAAFGVASKSVDCVKIEKSRGLIADANFTTLSDRKTSLNISKQIVRIIAGYLDDAGLQSVCLCVGLLDIGDVGARMVRKVRNRKWQGGNDEIVWRIEKSSQEFS